MTTDNALIPIFTTAGDVAAFLAYPYIFNCEGEWIGWISSDRVIYSTHGHYVGWLADGPRILRKLADGYTRSRIDIIPPFTMKINPPACSPLPPMMSELTFGEMDVMLDRPDLLPPVDFGELREDMD
ncbi:MAG: 4-fold beta flower protein [Anaerolineales bacterium]